MLHTLRTKSELQREFNENAQRLNRAESYLQALMGFTPYTRYSDGYNEDEIKRCIDQTKKGILRLYSNYNILLSMLEYPQHAEELLISNFILNDQNSNRLQYQHSL